MEKVKECIQTEIEKFIQKQSVKNKMSPVLYQEWKEEVLKTLDEEIKKCKEKYRYDNKARPVLWDAESIAYLNELQQNYFIVPVDKAAQNIVIICKKFYIERLIKELEINSSSGNDTYIKMDSTREAIITRHLNELKDKYNISFDDGTLKLTFIYWIPKFHKSPIKFRFIS